MTNLRKQKDRAVNSATFGDPPARPPLRVLCVDDNSELADSEVELLRIVGFEARASYSGPAALAEAALFRPSVCLIDLNMPGMDGDVLAVRLRQLTNPPGVLIAVTAMSNEASGQRVRQAGFNHHLIKPVDPLALIRIVDELWKAWCLENRLGPVPAPTAGSTSGYGSLVPPGSESR